MHGLARMVLNQFTSETASLVVAINATMQTSNQYDVSVAILLKLPL